MSNQSIDAKTDFTGKKVEFFMPNAITGDFSIPASLEVMKHYPQYENLNSQLLRVNDKEERQFIMRGKEFISDVSGGYNLIPNEDVLRTADEIAAQVGATPWHDFKGDWFVHADSHVMMNARRTHLHALYAWNEPVEIAKGDKINLGFSVHNGIDSGLGLGVGYFTFRHACTNMFMMGLHGKGQGGDDRNVYAHSYKKHMKNLGLDAIKNLIELVIKKGDDAIAELRALNDKLMTQAKVEQLITERLVSKEFIGERLNYITLPEEKDEKPKLNQDVTLYDVWNDVTDFITHNGNQSLDTKMFLFSRTQNLLEIAPLAGGQ